MTSQTQQEIVRKLVSLCELSPDIRIGQLFANLGFLAEDTSDRGLWDIEDEQFLQVIDKYATELSSRQSDVA